MPGLALVQRVETDESLPHSRIVLLSDTRHALAQGQYRLRALSPPRTSTDPDVEPTPVHPDLTPGAWVLLTHRSGVPLDHDTEVVPITDIIAILGPRPAQPNKHPR